jgi:succinoglycan biosynthesis transport protein ExoP
MSRNFELVEKLRVSGEMDAVEAPPKRIDETRFMSVIPTAPNGVENSRVLFAEITKLVQHLVPSPEVSLPRRIAFTCIEEGRDPDFTCARAGRVIAAQVKDPVCIVDANYETPSFHHYFALDNRRGLNEALRCAEPIYKFAHRLEGTNLAVVPSGTASVDLPALLSTEFPNRLNELALYFRYILISTPSVNRSGHAVLLGRMSDGVVMLVEANSTRREIALKAISEMHQANVRVLGTVLTNRRFPVPQVLYARI